MLHYIRKGSGQPLVLVHGFLGSHEIFHLLIDALSNHFEVIAVDLPGHGKSVVDKNSYSIVDYANAIVEVLEHEGIKEASWLGHSLGGYITLAALAENLAPIKKAILLNSSVSADTEEAKEKRTKQQGTIKDNGVDAFVDAVIKNFFGENASPQAVETGCTIAKDATVEGLALALDAMKQRPTRQNYLDVTSIPILIIEGDEDKIVAPIETNNSNVTKVIIKSGHSGMLEDVDGVLRAIYAFLE